MTSQRQLEANRRNAARSTGPRTPEGKAVVALNALQHGLLSRQILIHDEPGQDLVAFTQRLRADLKPLGELELLLVDRIVATAWRLRRLTHVEAALFDGQDEPAHAFGHYGREKMLVLSRYETALERVRGAQALNAMATPSNPENMAEPLSEAEV